MTDLAEQLAAGDLRSDGFANDVADIVAAKPELLPELMGALASENPAVRGHAADALEKVARARPAAFVPFLPYLTTQAISDDVPMVRWHLAMLLGHLSILPETIDGASRALFELLLDPSPFVRSWAITGLALTGLRAPSTAQPAVQAISRLALDPSPAVAKRARTALRALTDPSFRLPGSWVKGRGG